jgi:hypothetical protein
MAKKRTESQIANLTPDQKKSGIDTIYLATEDMPCTVEKILMKAITLL